MSLITELIERLRKEADGYMGYRSKRAVRVKHLLRESADTIETLSAKVQASNMERSTAYYNGGWIPVSERLPEESGNYLITYCLRDERETQEAVYVEEEDKWFDTTNIEITLAVIAWMPLPESYEPQESEGGGEM